MHAIRFIQSRLRSQLLLVLMLFMALTDGTAGAYKPRGTASLCTEDEPCFEKSGGPLFSKRAATPHAGLTMPTIPERSVLEPSFFFISRHRQHTAKVLDRLRSQDPEPRGKEKEISSKLQADQHAMEDGNSPQFPIYSVKFVRYPAPTTTRPGTTHPIEFCQRWPWASLTYALLSRKEPTFSAEKIRVVLRRHRNPMVAPEMTTTVLLDTIRMGQVRQFRNIKFMGLRLKKTGEKFSDLLHTLPPDPLDGQPWISRALRWLKNLFRPKDVYVRRFYGTSAAGSDAQSKNTLKQKVPRPMESVWRCYAGTVKLPDTLPTGDYILTVEGLPRRTTPFEHGPYFFPVDANGTTNDHVIDELTKSYSDKDTISRIVETTLNAVETLPDDINVPVAKTPSSGRKEAVLNVLIETPPNGDAVVTVRLTDGHAQTFFAVNARLVSKGSFYPEVRESAPDVKVHSFRSKPIPGTNLITLMIFFNWRLDCVKTKFQFTGSLKKRYPTGRMTNHPYNSVISLSPVRQ